MPHVIGVLEVVVTLNQAGVRFTLAGAHAVGGWTGQPRATQDVDVIVAARQLRKAVQALLTAFPHLQPEEHEVVTRLRDPESGLVAVDVMKPNQALMKAALVNTHAVVAGRVSYSIPSLEMALALKFAPMVNLNRSEDKKLFDAGDFIRMVKTNPHIDLDKLTELGELVYPGGGKEIVEMVRRVRAGERLIL